MYPRPGMFSYLYVKKVDSWYIVVEIRNDDASVQVDLLGFPCGCLEINGVIRICFALVRYVHMYDFNGL